MLELLPDLDFALKAAIKDGIGLGGEVRNLNRHPIAASRVRRAEHAGHSARSDDLIDAVVVQVFAGLRERHSPMLEKPV
jgi:hypothetical protein